MRFICCNSLKRCTILREKAGARKVIYCFSIFRFYKEITLSLFQASKSMNCVSQRGKINKPVFVAYITEKNSRSKGH